MELGIYYISSSLHNKEDILNQRNEFLKNLNFNFKEVHSLNELPYTFFFIESGGSEAKFKEIIKDYQGPIYILTKGENNSLAASLEILHYIHSKNLKGEILHGSFNYINKRIQEIITPNRLGVIGKPSDWLIGSNVDYKKVLDIFNIQLVDIDINELVNRFNKDDSFYKGNYNYDENEINKALKIFHSLNKIKEKYELDGLTLRCFDLLNSLHSTGCLALSKLNDLNIISTCEGDIPSLISMYLLSRNLNLQSFQANPSRIDLDDNNIVFAHCTIPLKMCESYSFDTHFESNIGIGIKGKLPLKEVTIFKISNDLKHYYVGNGTIVSNLNESNLCRTQIKIKYNDDLTYFLNRSLANHHVIVLSNYKDDIIKMMNSYGLERVI